MRKHPFLLVPVLLLAFGVSAFAEGKRFALLVGVKRYDHSNLTVLDFTENDATEMAKVLREANYQVTLLTDSEGKQNAELVPSKANIEKHLKAITDKRDRDDLILIGLAGHGLQFADDADAYFCPKDAKPFVEEKTTLLSLESVYKTLQGCNASAKVLLADCCRTDPQQGRGRNLENDLMDRAPPRGVYAFFSCSKDQKAFEHEKLKHGVFFYHVLEGLRGKVDSGDDQIDFLSLAVYVNKQVPRTVATVVGGGAKQTPNLKMPDASGQLYLISRANQALLQEWAQLEEIAQKVGLTEEIKKRAGERIASWKKAAEGGSAIGLLLYGRCLADGISVERDDYKAFELYQKATAQRNGHAINELGNMYLHGRGVTQDQFFAVDLYRKAAALGVTRSMYNLGRCYMSGAGVDKDLAKAVEWYTKSAEAGYFAAMRDLGVNLRDGRGTAKNEAKALEWFAKAADGGDLWAIYLAGYQYAFTESPLKDQAKGFAWLSKGAELGHAGCMDKLGFCYARGFGTPLDHGKAVEWYKKAVDLKEPDAIYHLGLAYLHGNGLVKDRQKGLDLLAKSVDLGVHVAIFDLGWQYCFVEPKNEVKGREWFVKGAELGDAGCMQKVGYCYAHGLGIAVDHKKAVEWFTKSANLGRSDGMYGLGNAYRHGNGVARDMSKALDWMTKSANLGLADAMTYLGDLYVFGPDEIRDNAKGFEWYTKGANLGDSSCMLGVGLCHAMARGTARDDAKAVEWYHKSANLGHSGAFFQLGNHYMSGDGVAKDEAKAVNYHLKAADKGNADSMTNLGFYYAGKQDYVKAFDWYKKATALDDAQAHCNMGAHYEGGIGIAKDLNKAIFHYRKAKGNAYAQEALKRLGAPP